MVLLRTELSQVGVWSLENFSSANEGDLVPLLLADIKSSQHDPLCSVQILRRSVGLVTVSWDSHGTTWSAILFLDSLLKKNPNAILVFSAPSPPINEDKTITLVFSENDMDFEAPDSYAFSLFDSIRNSAMDSFFPYYVVISDGRNASLVVDFTI